MAKHEIDISTQLAAMNNVYDEAKTKYASMNGETVPDGDYNGRQVVCKFYYNDSTSKLSLIREFIVTEGPEKGGKAVDFLNLSHEVGLSIAMEYLEVVGYEIPASSKGWEPVIAAIAKEKPYCRFTVEEKQGKNSDRTFTNISVEELLTDYENATSPDSIETIKVGSTRAEEPIDGLDGLDRKALKLVNKSEQLGVKIGTAMRNPDIVAALRDARKAIMDAHITEPEEPEEPEEIEDNTTETMKTWLRSATRVELKKHIKQEKFAIKVTASMKTPQIAQLIIDLTNERNVEAGGEQAETVDVGALLRDVIADELPDETVKKNATVKNLKDILIGYELSRSEMGEDSVESLIKAGLEDQLVD